MAPRALVQRLAAGRPLHRLPFVPPPAQIHRSYFFNGYLFFYIGRTQIAGSHFGPHASLTGTAPQGAGVEGGYLGDL